MREEASTAGGNEADAEGADGDDAPGSDRRKQRKKKRSRWGPQDDSAPQSSAPAPPGSLQCIDI